jgi:outer membrane receptor protein involved in Fe transport
MFHPALAQEIEEIVVTGTRIERQDYISPSPVYTVDRDDLLNDGTPTLTEYLNQSPQFAPATDKTSNFGGSGRGEVNLRGLGPNRTLVMIDGQRLGPAGSSGAVDLNTLPASMIESVEVLTGGASAVYGSDAVSGVVNVLLRRDFQGLEVNSTYDVTAENDGDTWDATLLWGTDFGDGAGNITTFYSRSERDEVRTSARDFTRQSIGEDGAGNLIPDGSTVTPAGSIPIPALVDGAFAPSGIVFNPDGTVRPFDQFDDIYNYYGEFNYLQIGMERDTVGVFTRYDLTDSMTAFLDITASSRVITFEAAPVPAGLPAAVINLDNPFLTGQARQVIADNYDPGNTGFYVGPFRYRMSPLGGRESEDELEDIQLRLGLEGEFLQGWQWRLNYSHYDFERRDEQTNFIQGNRFAQALLVDPVTGECFDTSNGCVGGNFFGEGNLSRESADFLRAPANISDQDIKQEILQFTVNGDLQVLDWNLALAFGMERREEESFSRGGDFQGGQNPEIGGRFHVNEIYAEFNLPVVADLPLATEVAVEAGWRYSDYNTIGSVDTWKAGFTWHITDSLLIRAMTQRAVRAPNLIELFDPLRRDEHFAAIFGNDIDNCSASQDPVGQGVADVCIAQGLAPGQVGVFESDPFHLSYIESGGNPDLDPEEADTFTVGFTWQPDWFEGFSIALDYYDIELDNAVNNFDRYGIINNCFLLRDAGSDFCQRVTRDETGNIFLVRSAPLNAAVITAQGIDLQLESAFRAPGFFGHDGELIISLVASHMQEQIFKAAPDSPALDCAGQYGFPCDKTTGGSNPEKRANISFSYSAGPLSLGAKWRWINGMDMAFLISGDPFLNFYTPAVPRVSSEDYLDLNAAWAPNENVTLRFGISNVLDTEPPIMGWGQQQSNTNPDLYDVLGRRYHVSLHYRL